MKAIRQEIIEKLKGNRGLSDQKIATIGIDGFVDKIQNVVKNKTSPNQYDYFSKIEQFASYLALKSGKSCGLEIHNKLTKLGGCAPIMANAVGALGVKVNCVSAFGYPSINEIFNNMSDKCSLHTIGEPGCTNALEFDDGKIMHIQRETLNEINWQAIKERVGIHKLRGFLTTSNMISFVKEFRKRLFLILLIKRMCCSLICQISQREQQKRLLSL
jgi:hypothetical protein